MKMSFLEIINLNVAISGFGNRSSGRDEESGHPPTNSTRFGKSKKSLIWERNSLLCRCSVSTIRISYCVTDYIKKFLISKF